MGIKLYILLGVILLLVVLVMTAVVRALLLKDKDVLKPLDRLSPEKKRQYAEGLLRLIAHQTIAGKPGETKKEFKALHNELELLFPLVHKHCERTVFEGGSLLFRWPGKSREQPIILMAHQDVVPATASEWSVDPFKGDIVEDKVIGRGSFDTKATLYAFLQAAEELLADGFVPEVDIYFSSSSDEEISGGGAEIAVSYLEKQGIKPLMVLDEGGAIVSGALPSLKRHLALIGVIEKGFLNLRFTAKSTGGHSSTPPKNSPIPRLARFIARVEKHFPLKTKMIPEVRDMFQTASRSMSFPYRLLFGNIWLFKGLICWLLPRINPYGRALFSTTIAFTMMKGSDAANVIPSEAHVLCNLRTHPIQDIESTVAVLSKIARKYNIDCEIIEGREATPIVNTKGVAYNYLVSEIRKNFPDVLVSPYIIFGGTDARFFTRITDSALRFSPVRITNDDLKKMHGIDECIEVRSLAEAVVFYKSFMSDFKKTEKV
ncbi:MAG: M20/M25/M40 family metallo-hydrolase [Candidatus Izemoplasmatales bacterium]|jgi:carboxypeptidase PM20D1